jgi:hypothetical protein
MERNLGRTIVQLMELDLNVGEMELSDVLMWRNWSMADLCASEVVVERN